MISNANPTIDQIYPVGTYYSTSNKDFNPNKAWCGIWELLPEGTILMAGSSDRSANDNKLLINKENIPTLSTNNTSKTLTGTICYGCGIPANHMPDGVFEGYNDGITNNFAGGGSSWRAVKMDATHEHTYTNNNQQKIDISSAIKSPIVYIWHRIS